MASFKNREHFIPLRVPDLLQFLFEERGPDQTRGPIDGEQRALVQAFSDEVQAHYHREYHELFRDLKNAYAPFDPDRDTVPLREPEEQRRDQMQAELFDKFARLLQRANYVHLPREQVIEIIDGASDWGVDMDVAWDVFERIEVYVRGEGWGTRTRRSVWNLFRPETKKLRTFARLAIILRQQPHRRIGPDADVRNVFLKLFKDMPKQDLEMTLPGTKLKMPKWEFRKLGASIASTIGYLGYKLWGFFTVGLLGGPITGWATPVGIMATYGYKQWYSFRVTKQQYQFQLTQSLYFQTLDSNGGVINRLLEDAEEQEVREVLLPYFYLWRYGDMEVWTEANLDDYIELEMERRLNIELDFEIDDAMDKLKRLGLVTEEPAPRWLAEVNALAAAEAAGEPGRAAVVADDWTIYRAVPLEDAVRIMRGHRSDGKSDEPVGVLA